MTIDEFNNTKFTQNMYAMYMGYKYVVNSINFEECLFGLGDETTRFGDSLIWVRCENIELVNA